MKIIIVILAFFLLSCSQNKATKYENSNKYRDGIILKNNSLEMKKCDVYSEFIKLRNNLVRKNIVRTASFYNFPITDQNLMSFIGSQNLNQDKQVKITLSNIDDFKTNFDRIFPTLFLSLLKRAAPKKDNGETFKNIDWEESYDYQNKLLERCRLQYKINKNIVILRFCIETIDETEKYETTVEYFFTFKNCELKFEKSIIAG